MINQLNIPLVANPDETHCFQACLKMILEATDLKKIYSWDELRTLTGKKDGKWTWPLRGLGEMSKCIYALRKISSSGFIVFQESAGTTRTAGFTSPHATKHYRLSL